MVAGNNQYRWPSPLLSLTPKLLFVALAFSNSFTFLLSGHFPMYFNESHHFIIFFFLILPPLYDAHPTYSLIIIPHLMN